MNIQGSILSARLAEQRPIVVNGEKLDEAHLTVVVQLRKPWDGSAGFGADLEKLCRDHNADGLPVQVTIVDGHAAPLPAAPKPKAAPKAEKEHG